VPATVGCSAWRNRRSPWLPPSGGRVASRGCVHRSSSTTRKGNNWKLEFDFGNDADETGERVDFSRPEELGSCPKRGGRVFELGRNYVCDPHLTSL
jgi:hypothetical protein